MSMPLPLAIVQKVEGIMSSRFRNVSHLKPAERVMVDSKDLTAGVLTKLLEAANELKDPKTARALECVISAQQGEFGMTIPSFPAFVPVLERFLRQGLLDGWIYVETPSGVMLPELVTRVSVESRERDIELNDCRAVIHTLAITYGGDNARVDIDVKRNSYRIDPCDISRRRVADILARAGLHHESPELRAAYEQSLQRARSDEIAGGFGRQFRFTGKRLDKPSYEREEEIVNARVIHDLPASELHTQVKYAESEIVPKAEDGSQQGVVPRHPCVRVFDLQRLTGYWVHSSQLRAYEYDPALAEKIVLPTTHRGLLDVLTSDMPAIAGMVEGKSTGSVVLCVGPPGVGKTLTAEIYAEITRKPLYTVRSGELGSSAQAIEANLAKVLDRARRWRCVTLINEADVYVARRGDDMERNAVCAVFLKALEYFDGLIFLTSNRPDDIDDAFISRCLAIFKYEPPEGEQAKQVWRIQAAQCGLKLSEKMIAQLHRLFDGIAPRDVEKLCALVARISQARSQAPSLELFRVCGMCRAVTMHEAALAG